jgi:hypothetical protein
VQTAKTRGELQGMVRLAALQLRHMAMSASKLLTNKGFESAPLSSIRCESYNVTGPRFLVQLL